MLVQADTRIDLLAFANEPPEGTVANLWLEYGRINLEGYEIYVPVFITSRRQRGMRRDIETLRMALAERDRQEETRAGRLSAHEDAPSRDGNDIPVE